MALESQTRTIGGSTYSVTQFGAKLGNRVLMKVMKSVAPVLIAAISSDSLQSLDAGAITAALAAVSEDDFDWLVGKFADSTVVVLDDGRNPELNKIFELHFAGKYGEEMEWIAFCLEVNFGLFFQELSAKAAAAKAKRDASKAASTPSP